MSQTDDVSPVLALNDITFTYPNRPLLLDRLSLTILPGDCIGVIGQNGSGKSTLLHIIMGLLKPDSGTISLFGKTMAGDADFQTVRRMIGFVFQNADDQLFSPTVLEDVAFGPLNYGKSADEAKSMAEKTLADLGLNGYENRVTHRLSGGEKKLVSIATVLVMSPGLLILDEPTTGLSPETVDRITEILNRLSISLLIVSHEYHFLRRVVSSGVLLENGRLARREI